MTPRRRHLLRASASILAGLAFALWTWLTVSHHLPSWFDASSTTQRLDPAGDQAEVMAAIAVDTRPIVVAVAMAALSVWAWRRRLRQVAWAIVIGITTAWVGFAVLKSVFRRPRPASPLSHLGTYSGWSYPSGHMAVATAAAILVIATTTTTRQTRATILGWRLAMVSALALVAYNRWVLNAHWPSDIVGGALWGAFSAITALVVCGVHMLPVWVARPRPLKEDRPVCAVVYNPTKVLDVSTFRRHVEYELRNRGWWDAMWLPTTRDDAGVAMSRQAVAAGVDLVIVAGGDGTVRVVCSELANTGVPVAIVPAGTGNLLARNLGIPMDESAALGVAFGGQSSQVDLIRIEADDQQPTHCAVMAGIGIDARIMEGTNADLKRTVGSAAYFVAAAQQITSPPVALTYVIDDAEPVQRTATLALLGNVGFIQAGIQIFPDASPRDGMLDVVVASTSTALDWATIATRVITRTSMSNDSRVDVGSGRRVEFDLGEPTPYELDGDTRGSAARVVAEVEPRALTIKLPA